MRAIHLYCDLVAGAVLDGLQAELVASGIDIGARAQLAGGVAGAGGGEDDGGDQAEREPPATMGEALAADGAEGEANEARA